jgi:hypothetical protein
MYFEMHFCRLPLLLIAACIVLVTGCKKESAGIRQYRVERSRSDLGSLGLTEPRLEDATPKRMIVAIAERPNATWFFKLLGPVKAVDASEQQWRQLLAAIEFGADEKPRWGEAADWQTEGPRPMRFATLTRTIPDAGTVELAISSLGPNQDILNNVNRWRGQLSLDPVAADAMHLSTIDAVFGTLRVFDAKQATGTEPISRATVGVPMKPTFTIPAGWQQQSSSAISPVKLSKGTEENSPRITVTQLLAEANEWLPNARRWAEQVAMDDDLETIQAQTSSVKVDNHPGQKIRLIPVDESKPLGLIGVMVVREELAWFFKLIGEREQIVASEKEFEQFLESFRFN